MFLVVNRLLSLLLYHKVKILQGKILRQLKCVQMQMYHFEEGIALQNSAKEEHYDENTINTENV